MPTLAVSYGDKTLYFTPFGGKILVTCHDTQGELLWRGKMNNVNLWDGKGWNLENVLKKLRQWVKEESVIAPQ